MSPRKQKDRYPELKSPEGSIEQSFRDGGSDKGADKNLGKIFDKTTNTFAAPELALFNMSTEARRTDAARPVDATRVTDSNKLESVRPTDLTKSADAIKTADAIKSTDIRTTESLRGTEVTRSVDVNRPVDVNRSTDAASGMAAARAEAQSRAEANRAEAVRRSEAMRAEAIRTEAARTEAQRRVDAVRTQTARSEAMRAEAQRRAEQNRAEALRNDSMRAEAQRRAEAERAEAIRRAEAKKAPSALAGAKNIDSADKTPGAVGALAFLSVLGATKELQALKQSDPEKYGKMTLEQVRQHKLSEEVGSRDKMSFMGLAMCNPFFLMALGATFAVMDDIKASRAAKQKANGVNAGDAVNGQAGGQRRAVKGETLEETKAKQAELRPKSLSPEGARLLGLDKNKKNVVDSGDSGYLKFGLKKSNDSTKEQKPSGRADDKGKQKLFNSAESSWEERAAARSLKNWIKTDQLIKKKQALGDQMERINGRAQYSEVASLAAKIQLVDKALKQQAQ
ncbi:MAG: hypothetical protein WCT03_19685 [Candidatus Obscuribacterales bacterium]